MARARDATCQHRVWSALGPSYALCATAAVVGRWGRWIGAEDGPIRDGTTWVDLTLDTRLDSRVTLTVRGPDGELVEDAVGTWDTETAGCAPEETSMPFGLASVELGAGAHRLHVAAPGYEPLTVSVYVGVDDPQELDLELTSSFSSASGWDPRGPS